MKIKEILIICIIIICCIFSLQAVSAADADTSHDTVLSSTNVSVYTLPNLEDSLQSGSVNAGTFSDLQNDTKNGGSITLNKNYTYNSSSDSSLAGGIVISKDTTIDGNGNVIIDANHLARVFKISSGTTVTLKGITFINANPTSGHGGSILAQGVVHIDNCNFINNTANYANGGAVCLVGLGSTINNSYFEGNRAINNGKDSNGAAGAVFINANNTEIKNSIFIKNMAGLNGGAIGSSAMHVENCTITNCTINNNTANGSAGGVGMQSKNFHIYNSTFKYNEAKGLFNNSAVSPYYPGNGGGLVMRGWDSYAYNCTFIGNIAKQHGGGVYSTNTSYDPTNNNTGFELCTFINNTAGSNGGAVDWAAGATHGYIKDSTFTNNTAKRSGGAIHWSGHYGTISNSTFTHNNATGEVTSEIGGITGGGDGGAVVWVGSHGMINDSCIFTGNEAKYRGGAIFLHGNATENCTNITVDSCTFKENIAGTNGGAIDWHEGSHDGEILNSIFEDNIAKANGGAVYWRGHDGEIINSNFTNNTAKGLLKGRYNNTGDGGAIFWAGVNGNVSNSRFINNRAIKNVNNDTSGRGGAIYIGSCDHGNRNITITNSYFEDNNAGTNGGAIDWYSGAHDGLVSDSQFINNIANRSGGAIFWNGHNGTIKNSNFTYNQALGITAAKSVLGPVTYGGDGGAVMWSGALGTVDNVRFIGNKAHKNANEDFGGRGGAVFLQAAANETSDDTKFINVYFEDNVAGTNGGAIDWNKGARDGLVENATFVNNIANRSGGAIFWNGHNGTIKNANFTNNQALGIANATSVLGPVTYGGDGGAVMWSGALGDVENCNFINNTAAKSGGAVFLQSAANETCDNTTFKDSHFENNTAGTNGGAIDWNAGAHNGIVSNVTFVNNIANRFGGAIFWNGYNGTVRDSNFTNNSALGTPIYSNYVNLTSFSQVYEVPRLPIASDVTVNRLYVLVSYADEWQTVKTSYELYVTDSNTYEWIKIRGTNETDSSATDFAIDSFFAGDGGSIIWEGDLGLVDNCRFIDSNSARRGGAAYMIGSDNITFSNSYFEMTTSGTNGGSLDWLAGANYGKVINCTFNNTRAARSAGAIYYNGNYGQIINVTIINTTAFGGSIKESEDHKVKYTGWDSSHWNTNTTGGDAGAIMFTGNHVYVCNVTFTNCTAAGRGGAVFLQDNDNVTFVNCTFEENSALGTANNTWKDYTKERNDANVDTKLDQTLTGHGGAIAFDVGANNGIIINSTFNSNHATRDGGAAYYAYGAVRCKVINSTFTNHVIECDGGAVYFNGNDCELHNSTFINNTAGDDGGAVYWQGDRGIIYNITCDYNNGTSLGTTSSPSKGGAVIITGSNIALSKSTFTNSYSGVVGGTIFITGNNVNITDSVFKNSTIELEDGGAIYVLGNNTLIANCTFDNCTSPRDGGTIYVLGDVVILRNLTITNSSAITGGGIYISGEDSNIDTLQISYSTAVNGGGIYISGNNATINNTSFSKLNSTEDGAAVYVAGDYGRLFNSNFTYNSAGDDGGAIYWEGDYGIINNVNCNYNNGTSLGTTSSPSKGGSVIITGSHNVLSNSTFANSYAGVVGGTIFVTGNDVNITDSTFKKSRIGLEDGGTIYILGNNTNILNCTIEDSNARYGGAIFIEGENATVSAKFINTNATLSGGSIYVEGENATILNSSFDNTRAFGSRGDGGGAIFIQGDNANIIDSNFTYNYANYNHEARGGAIYIQGLNTTVSGSEFEHSRSNLYGGSIYIQGDYATISESNFTDCTVNSDNSQGGAIYINGHFTTIDKSDFESNSAKGDGGTIYVQGNNATISESIFNKSSTTSGSGGAMYVQGNGAVISASNFTLNTAKIAGAMYINGNNATISYSVFDKNSVNKNQAGALFNNGKGSRVLYSNFTNNVASTRNSRSQDYGNTGEGGAILWKGGSEIDAIEGCLFDSNSAKFGGAIRWLATGSSGIIHNCTFVRNNGEKGGTISWNSNQVGHIDNCTFISNVGSKNGGALYLQNAGNTFFVTNVRFINNTAEFCGADIANNFKYAIIENCTFVNSTSGYGGSIVMKEADPSYSQVINCNFTNTRSLGIEAAKYDADGDAYANGGGAIYVTYSNIKVINSTFTNCSSNTDGGVFKWFGNNGGGGVLENVTIINAKATGTSKTSASTIASGDGGAIYWTANTPTFKNVTIVNASARNNGGGIYLSGSSANLNLVTIENSSAKNGGAIYWANSGGTIKNIDLINNTAENGGGFYTESFTGKLENANFTLNKAQNGSAIYTTKSLTLNNTSLLKNRANSSSPFEVSLNWVTGKIEFDFKGWDNYLNAIYVTSPSNTLNCFNVTYLNESGVVNPTSKSFTGKEAQPTLESGQNFTVVIGDKYGKQINVGDDIFTTNENGHVSLNIYDVIGYQSDDLFVDIYLTNEDYYTRVKYSTRIIPTMEITTTNATFHLNGTVSVELTNETLPLDPAATGNVSVYINKVFMGNITVDDHSKGTIEISTLVNGTYLDVGSHTIVLRYAGDGKYSPLERTGILNVTQAGSTLLLNVTPSYDSFTVNVTVVHNETGIVTDPNDSTGNVTISVYDKTVTVELVNGTGIAVIYDLPVGPIPVYATYSGDNNYLTSVNSTTAELTNRTRTTVKIEVNSHDIMVNETIIINVTVISDGTPVEGNITIVLDNVEYEVTLNNSKASFNKTGLSAGQKVVVAIFAGNETLAPSSARDTFMVHKYNATVIIDTENITYSHDEIINITVPSDGEGVVYVTMNGTTFKYKSILEIKNGTVTIPFSRLGVDVYNITVSFEDDKYVFTTNSTLFNVSKLTPEILIDVNHITYGNDTIIVVTVPDVYGGNVTLKINDTLVVFEDVILENNQATFIVKNLPADNYTIDVTYNGDIYDNPNSTSSNFTVYKCDPVLDVIVSDIYYGELEHIIIKVNASGNVTVRVAGNETNITLKEDGTAIIHIDVLRAAINSAFELERFNGRADEYVHNLAVGNYPVEVIYNGNHNFNPTSKTVDFNVKQVDTILDIQKEDIYVWDNETINVLILDTESFLEERATGNVTIYIDGVRYSAKIENGIAKFNITDLSVGHKVIWAFYDGDRNLTGNKSMAQFNVKQRTPVVNVTAINVTTAESGKLTINIPANATGYVIVTGNFSNYQIRVDNFNNGVAEIPLEMLAKGTYGVHIKYYGEANDNYTIAENDAIFKVSPANTTINITVKDITYGEKVNITVNVTDGATGFITVGINETTNVTLPIVNGTVNWIIEGLGVENYTVWANYSGDTRFNINSTNKTFKVKMVNSVLNILTPVSVDAATNATIVVTVNETATGNITITVNGTKYNATINNGVATFVIDKLLGGTYDITAEYIGDGNNTAAAAVTAQNALVITKVACYQINVSANDTKVGLNTTIVVKVPVDAKGNVSIYVDGEKIANATINNGVAKWNVTKAYGNHTVNVTFSDGKYDFRYAIADFWVFKHDSPLVIDVDSILVGDVVYINVTAPSDNVTIEINGKSYNNVKYENGVAYFNVAGLTYGNKTVVAIYGGSDKYVVNSTTKNFAVDKRNADINISVENITYGDKVNITVNVTDDAKGFITIRINETRNITLPIVGGKVNWIVDGLGVENYTVWATYNGDTKYNVNTTNKTFNVTKAVPVLSIDPIVSVDAATNATIIVRINETATGNITVTVNNTKYNATIENGVATFVINKLLADTYDVTAEYIGDNNYTAAVTLTVPDALIVTKITCYQINVSANDTKVGLNTTIVVKVPVDAKGNVSIYVDGEKIANATINAGVAEWNVTKTYGNHTVNVTFSDDKYDLRYAVTDYWVFKHDSPLEIKVDSILVGDIAYINVTAPSDNVTIEINGKYYTKDRYVGNVAYFNVTDLVYGNKTVVAIYGGSDKYVQNTTTKNFTVNKRASEFNVTVTSPISVGDNATVSVEVPADAKGYVVVNVGGNNYTINLTAGQRSVEIAGLKSTTYKVNVTYLGDDKYLSSINNTREIKVDKVPSTINLTVSEDGIIAHGHNVNITVEVPVDATGKVNVTLYDGVDIIESYIIYVNEGKGLLHLDVPAIGFYRVTGEYLGDDKYLGETNHTAFEVYATGGQLTVIAESIYVNENGTINVTIPGKYDGEMTIIVSNASGEIIHENVTITPGAFSNATMILPLLDAGTYDVWAIYIEVNGSKTVIHEGYDSFNVDKLPSQIIIENLNATIFVGENETIKLAIDLDSRANGGNISVFINGVEYNTTTSKLTLEIPNLNAADYNVRVIYHGNDWYLESNVTASFKVVKNFSPIDIEVTNSSVGGIEQINVTLLRNVSGQVLLDIDGQHYYANVSEGLAQFNITGLEAGEHDFNVTYLGDYKFLSNNTNSTLKVSKIQPVFAVNGTNITVGSEELIKFETSENITGAVKVEINDKNYTAFIIEGKGNLTVYNLPAGDYNVTVYFKENEKYLSASAKNNFTINKTSVEISLSVVNITYLENETVVVYVDAVGNVTLEVGTYVNTTDLVGGKATFIISGLAAGNYTANATYNGNINLTSVNGEANFTVAKAAPELSVIVNNITYYSVEDIIVNVNVGGNVTIKVNGTVRGRELIIDNGKVELKLNGLAAGIYPVEVIYNGNENYTSLSTDTFFVVNKAPTTLEIEVSDINVTDSEIINVTISNVNATGKVIINVDGVNYTRDISNGKVNLTLDKLGNGTHSVVAIYVGDRNLTGNWSSTTFNVEKLTSELTINVSDINVGQKETIKVNVTSGATGIVVISVNGKDYQVEISGGFATLELDDLANGTYTVYAKYLGNANYSESRGSDAFNVSKVKSNINLTVSYYGIIANGSDVNITIEAPLDATGKVNVTISNGVENRTYIVYVNDGIGILHLETPEIGIYNVTAKYLGDDKYLGSENKTEFEVYLTGKELSITTEPIKVKEDEIILVYVSGNHVGKEVEIIVKDSQGNIITRQNSTFDSYIPVLNGTSAILVLDNLDAGEYTVDAIYIEINGTKRIKHNGSGSFEVSKLPTQLEIKEIKNITVGENVTIELEFGPGEATGNISVFVNGIEHVINTTNLKLVIPNLGAEEYYVHALYYGDKNYLESNATAEFKVSKNPVPVEINVTNSNVGEIEQINVTLAKDATGRVLLDIGDNHYYANVTNGTATFNIKKLDAGKYNFTVTYEGDDKYFTNKSDSSFIVSKYQPEFTVNGTDIIFGKDELIKFETKDNITAPVKVEINGVNYTAFINEGKGNLTLYDLPAGDYNITLYFLGNEKYLNASAKNSFTVNKSSVVISVIPVNITYLDNETVVVYVDAVGNVTLKVDTYENTTELIDGKATFVIKGLNAGSYTVNATFSGNDNLTSVSAEADFTVFKIDPVITLEVQNITYGDMEHIIVHVNAEGNVTIRVNGTEETIVLRTDDNGFIILRASLDDTSSYDGKAHEYIYNLKPGEYPVEVTFNGNNNYNTATTNGVFYVSKANSTIKVDVDDIVAGEVAVINITLPENATGDVTVTIDARNFTAKVVNGTASVKVDNLTAGDKSVFVEYSGDDNYTSAYAISNFTVDKAKTVPDLTVVDQGNGTVVVVVGDNATGNVTISVDGQNFTAEVINGTAVVELNNLTPGVHDVEVIYSGDGNHTSSSINSTVEAPKYDTPINITVGEVTEGETAVINVTVPEGASGNVTVYVDGKEYSAEIVNGTASVKVDNLTAGDKSIIVEYPGDANYTSGYAISNFTVDAAKVVPDLSVVDLGNGTVVVVVGDNATGNVTISVDGQNFTAEVINGTAYVTLNNVNPGVHDVEVIYSGDGNHTSSSINSTVEAPKYDAPINVTVGEVTEGETAVINVTVPAGASGNVTVYVGGKEYSAEIVNGTASVKVDNLTAGDKSIIVEYPGDANYTSGYAISNFTVDKAKVVPDLTVVDYGNGTVVVVVGDNATGNVTISVDGQNFTAEVINGTAVVELNNVTPGVHDVEIIYSGDGNHTSSSINSTVEAPKYDTPINITVGEVTEGEPVVINVTVPRDASGNVTVYVDGHVVTAEIVNGTASVKVDNLTAGDKTVTVEYSGDANYTSGYAISNFTVDEAKVVPDLTVVDYGNGTVVVVVGDNATGNVTISVDGKNFTAEVVNGTAVVELNNLTPGVHDVEVIYSGDDAHDSASTNSTVEAPKYDTPINITVGEVTEGEPVVINVTVPEGASGNVTVYVDGHVVTAEIVNGTASVKVDNLTAGDKSIIVEYSGDANYTSGYAISNFTVDKAKVVPDLTVVDYGNGTVVVVVGDNATGNVTVSVDGQNFTAEVINGTAYVTLNNVTPGVHDVEIIYSGDGNHTSSSINSTVEVPKLDSTIDVSVGAVTEGEVAVITVIVPGDASGNVTVYVDGQVVTAEVIGGVAVVEVGNLTAGDKTVTVEYSGDDNYTAGYAISNFTVDEAKSVPDLTVVDYGNGTVVVVVGDNATGNVTVSVDGKNFTAEVINGTAVVELNNLTPGVHDVEVIYSGDDTHNYTSTNSTVEAPKYDSPINITVGEVTEGETAVINVTVPEGASGNVTVYVDGKEYSAEIVNGTATVKVDNLTAGDKSIFVEYPGDANYTGGYAISNFTVDKAKTSPELFVVDHGNGTVVVVVGDNATGNVTVSVDGKNFTAEVINGTATVTVGNLTPGTHNVEVIYSGDDTHNSTSTNSTVDVPKYDSPINITVGEVTEGEPVVINVAVPEGASGNVTVYVDGKEYSAEVVNGTASVKVDNLTAGDKTIIVEYPGDANYTSGYAISNFTVDKAKTSPELFVVDHGNGTVVVVVGDNATGNVTVSVDGKNFTAEVINGTATVTVGNLTPGVHDVEVIYSGDDTHYSSSTNSTVDVPKYDSPINITVGEVTEGEPVVINVTVPEGASGNVTVYVDGKEYSAEVVNGTASVKVDNLTAGDKSIFVEYSGDANYTSGYAISNFTVDKAKSVPDLTVVDLGNGTIVVVAPKDATGNVTVKVGDKEFNATVENGTATVHLDGLTPGEHEIEVIYSGDENYENATVKSNAITPKLETPINVTVDDIYVGDKAIITVNVPEGASGNVTIEIDGEKYTAPINDGKATFEVPDLIAGTKTIAVDYPGDDNYLGNHTTAKISVSKRPSYVEAKITDIGVGENVTIEVRVPNDATGQVLIDIDGVGYYVNVTNGKGVTQIPRIPSGIYNVNLTYTGDDKYEASSTTSSFNVTKIDSFVIPEAEDIYVGDLERMIFTLPSDATGRLEIIINGEGFEIDLSDYTLAIPVEGGEKYVISISYGFGKLTVADLPKGEYTVSVYYEGDEKYLPCQNTTKFTVSERGIDLDVVDYKNRTVVVSVPEDATGTITIVVENQTYVANITDGKAVFYLENATPGVHDIKVIYSGDDTYGGKTIDSKVEIPKYETPISVSVEDIYVDDNETVTVSLPEDAKGKVTISIDGKEYATDAKDGKAVFDVPGLTAGNKTVTVKYEGDDSYKSNETTADFSVLKRQAPILAISEDIKVGDDETISIFFPKDATGRAILKMGEDEYYADIIDGEAKIRIPNLLSGTYEAEVIYGGDAKYVSNATATKFTVTKNSEPILAFGDDIILGDDGTVVVTLPSDATGTVTITVDGKSYTAEVINGKAVFTIPGLDVGVHVVDVYYSGDDKYEANQTTTKIIVEDKNPNPDEDKSGSEMPVTMHPTGNPILVLMLMLMAVGSVSLRRFKKE
ncbi:Ig-like domain repeat protein [Methanobrevibacter sp.]|uniref:Ig-like domain repeat protein n=1 Tax=Methanobrevibacter sp. TaxID=66852 RepID=UPI00388FC070